MKGLPTPELLVYLVACDPVNPRFELPCIPKPLQLPQYDHEGLLGYVFGLFPGTQHLEEEVVNPRGETLIDGVDRGAVTRLSFLDKPAVCPVLIH